MGHENAFDDRDPSLIPSATDPVLAGLQLLVMHVDEELGTLRPDECYVVFFEGRLRKSVRRELPPVRGALPWISSAVQPGGRYTQTRMDVGDPCERRRRHEK